LEFTFVEVERDPAGRHVYSKHERGAARGEQFFRGQRQNDNSTPRPEHAKNGKKVII